MTEAQPGAPAWRRPTAGEPRWPASLAAAVAITLLVLLPQRLVVLPKLLLPGLAFAVLVGVFLADPRRIGRERPTVRAVGLGVVAILSVANAIAAGRLITSLVQGHPIKAPSLLLNGGAIWLTNVIVFALWYWEFDRGGPAARALNHRKHLDFLFPQMSSPELASQDWEPTFVDYLYLSFTNATAFSPTDVMPLSGWAKMMMLLQSAVSVSVVILVVARAVNIL